MTPTLVRVDWRLMMLLGLAAALSGCTQAFEPRNFANPEALFRASLLEYQRKEWDNAQAGFERLTYDLSARDPLLAPAYFYLALTHEQRKEYLLAAQAFERLADGFPEDTLAPVAMLGMGRSYQKLWRKPGLDAEYGQKASSVLRALLSSYPEAKEVTEARARISTLEEWFARKDYEIGIHYMRVRRTIDPAIIYFKDVVTTYPSTPSARLAWLRLHELYTKIRWKEDAAEACTAMWKAYAEDKEVLAACGPPPTEPPKPGVTDTVPVAAGYARPGPR